MGEKEETMENRLLRQLVTGKSQWTYRPDIHTEEDLWNNFRDKLNKINRAALRGKPLTDGEFRQVRAFIHSQSITPYQAGCWLAGENGVAQIPLVREDVKEDRIALKAINNREVAGGDSSYEVIHQFVSDKAGDMDRTRRFDVTLLINGMPLIQIELKNRDHPFMDGFRQIQKYARQGHFRGLFGLLQMFVVTNGTDTRYIAADTADKLNENFLTPWLDTENRPVNDYLEFAKDVLSIPAAHNMVGKYSVMDKTREKIILLRPYQIHAIEAIRRASREGKSGFIWHTTGSGKTLTSYNVTKNLLDIPTISKTLFLIDRKDLDTQTTEEFQAYAETDSIDVDETENTGDLERKLLDKRQQAIVTTIQKLQNILRRFSKEKAAADGTIRKKYEKLRQLRIAFIVDECHRTVSAETKRQIEGYFADSLWYGFTGTPIFAENRKAVKGDLPDTTEKLYGPVLHTYTIKDAIRYHAVLGFNVEMHDNLTDGKLRLLAEQYQLGERGALQKMDRISLEKLLQNYYMDNKLPDFYGNDRHKKAVLQYILTSCEGKFGMHKGEGHTYDAMLTVGSIGEAQRYYSLLKEMVQQEKVPEAIRKQLPDFPKFAITYTVGENQDGALANQTLMQESLRDYNEMFGTRFGLEDGLRGYNTDLQKRLARKESKYRDRQEQLDLVIVVNRLLTGFDAPCMSTLFLDRPPMPPQNLIQAFSRTNRIFDSTKTYGQIVIFRTPGIYQKAVDDAIFLYSNGGSPSDVMAPTFAAMQKKLKWAVDNLKKTAATPESVDLNDETEVLSRYAKAFQVLDHTLASIAVYQEWKPEMLEEDYGYTREEADAYKGKYVNTIEELKKRKTDPDTPDVPQVDVEYELEATSSLLVNYKYIVALIQRYIPDAHKGALFIGEENDAAIKESLEKLARTNPQLTEIIRKVWDKIRLSPTSYAGMQASELIRQAVEREVDTRAEALAETWCAVPEDIKFHALHGSGAAGYSDLKLDYQAYKAKGGKEMKLRYFKKAREEIQKSVEETIKPLLEW